MEKSSGGDGAVGLDVLLYLHGQLFSNLIYCASASLLAENEIARRGVFRDQYLRGHWERVAGNKSEMVRKEKRYWK